MFSSLICKQLSDGAGRPDGLHFDIRLLHDLTFQSSLFDFHDFLKYMFLVSDLFYELL